MYSGGCGHLIQILRVFVLQTQLDSREYSARMLYEAILKNFPDDVVSSPQGLGHLPTMTQRLGRKIVPKPHLSTRVRLSFLTNKNLWT
jgi:hypothetical protein